jgi:hypothetical protein
MGLKKIRIGAVAVVLFAVAAVIIRQHQRADHLGKEIAILRDQAERTAFLQEENQRLAEQLEAATERTQADARELARLRGQASTMRQTEQENVRLKAERESSTKEPTQTEKEEAPYDRLFGAGSNMRMSHAMRWGYALISYASEHQGQFPSSFEEALSFLGPDDVTPDEKAQTALTADQYEMLYHGRRENMTNPPPEGAIIIRGKQPWQTSEGKWARTYIYGNGFGTIHSEPDGNFEKWESVRIPKTSGQ